MFCIVVNKRFASVKTRITVIVLSAFFALAAVKYREDTPTAINFYKGSYKSALAEAKKQNKLIFIDAYTSWCGPCKMLRQNTFTDKEVGEYFNEHFINLSIDAEKGEGVELANKYKVHHYPTLIITDNNGERITFTVGYIQPDDLLGFGRFGVSKTPSPKD